MFSPPFGLSDKSPHYLYGIYTKHTRRCWLVNEISTKTAKIPQPNQSTSPTLHYDIFPSVSFAESEDLVTDSNRRFVALTLPLRLAALRTVGLALGMALVSLSGLEVRAERIPLTVKLPDKGFEQIARDKGVVVYKHTESDIIRLGAEGRMSAPPDEVQAVLLDYGAQRGRIDRVSKSRIIERSPKHITVYQHLNLPVISDRDFNLRVTWGEDSGTKWIEYKALNKGGVKPKDGIVRVTLHNGSWQLKPMSRGRSTYVRMMVMVDMAGMLPKWLAKMHAGKELPALFASFRKMLRERRKAASGAAKKTK